jgi:ABC-type nitrate/sulfonate/bicarbonate transport system substrate-binding protein
VTPVVTEFANISANLQAGRVDAAVTIPPFTGQIEAAGGHALAQPYESIGTTVEAQLLAISPSFAQAHPQVATEFRDALSDAAAFIATHKQQTLDALQKFTGLSASVVKTVPLPDFNNVNLTETDIQTWQKVLVTVTGDKSYDAINVSEYMTH